MSGIPEARMLDTKIKNRRLYSVESNIILLLHLVQMAAILDYVTFRCIVLRSPNKISVFFMILA